MINLRDIREGLHVKHMEPSLRRGFINRIRPDGRKLAVYYPQDDYTTEYSIDWVTRYMEKVDTEVLDSISAVTKAPKPDEEA